MRRLATCLVSVASILTWCQHADGWGGRHGAKTVVMADRPQLAELANRPERFEGYWVNSNDWFYFAGDTKALNDFLADYAEMRGTPRVLTIHAGRAPMERCLGEPLAKPVDWQLQSRGRLSAQEDQLRRPDGGSWRRVVTVDVWLGGNVRLDQLKVPTEFEVRSGGEIEQFIEDHKRRHAEADPPSSISFDGEHPPSTIPSDPPMPRAGRGFQGWYLDFDDSAEIECIGKADSSRNLVLTQDEVPGAFWKLIEREQGYQIQAQAGRFEGWYLDFDDDAKVQSIGGAESARNLLLTKEEVPGAYWELIETDQGHLIRAQTDRFRGWYLDFDADGQAELIDGPVSARILLLTNGRVPGAYWQLTETDGGYLIQAQEVDSVAGIGGPPG